MRWSLKSETIQWMADARARGVPAHAEFCHYCDYDAAEMMIGDFGYEFMLRSWIWDNLREHMAKCHPGEVLRYARIPLAKYRGGIVDDRPPVSTNVESAPGPERTSQ